MTRCTTPTHFFRLPVPATDLKDVLLTYVQNDQKVLEKELDDMTADGNLFSVKLTQAETKSFTEGNVEVQIRILTKTGDALASKKKIVSVSDVLNDVVMA